VVACASGFALAMEDDVSCIGKALFGKHNQPIALEKRNLAACMRQEQGQRTKERGFLRAFQPIVIGSRTGKLLKTLDDQTRWSHRLSSIPNFGTKQRARVVISRILYKVLLFVCF